MRPPSSFTAHWQMGDMIQLHLAKKLWGRRAAPGAKPPEHGAKKATTPMPGPGHQGQMNRPINQAKTRTHAPEAIGLTAPSARSLFAGRAQ